MGQYKKGMFNHETLTVHFGGELSKPENIFTAQAIKVPTYKLRYKERESLGNGWYGGTEWVEKEMDNTYIILKDNVIIGYMVPYHPIHKIKSDLLPITNKIHGNSPI